MNDDQKLLYKSLKLNKIFSNTSQELTQSSKENASIRKIPNFNLVKKEATEQSINIATQPTDRFRSPKTARINPRMETWSSPTNMKPILKKKSQNFAGGDSNLQSMGTSPNNNVRRDGKLVTQKGRQVDEDEYLHNFIKKKPTVK